MKGSWNINIIIIACIMFSCKSYNERREQANEPEDFPVDEYGIPLGAAKADSFYIEEAEDEQSSVNINEFMELFEEVDFDTLHVFSYFDSYDHFVKYQGKKIDIKYSSVFEDIDIVDHIELSAQEGFGKDYYVFACYKFKVNNNTQGMLIRRYGQYAPNRIDLCFWDNSSNKFVSNFEMAISYGNEEYSTKTESWIYKANGWKILTKVLNKKNEDVVSDSSYVRELDGTNLKNSDTETAINESKVYFTLKWKYVAVGDFGYSYVFENKKGEEILFTQLDLPEHDQNNNPYYTPHQVEGAVFPQYEINEDVKGKWYRISIETREMIPDLMDEPIDVQVIYNIEALD